MISESKIIETARNVLQEEAQAILELIERLDSRFIHAVDLIFDSHGKTVLTGMGKSGLIAKKISATLASTGTPSFFMHPAEAGHGDLGMVTSDDVVIAISNSGETEEILRLIPFFKRFNINLISMTGNMNSTLSRESVVSIDITVKEEACPMGVVPTSSTTATLAMGDALAVVLLLKRGFKKEDFAFFHPNGAIGKKLFIKVSDLMHSGDSLPYVTPQAKMAEAVMEISSKRLGVTIVADSSRKILGIITDGDLRRGIAQWGRNVFDMEASEVMTKNPRYIDENELAAKALSVMETHAITSLIVPDTEGCAIGIIHLHDILRKGIV
ncbi:MAG: KpsF/GutQ family sugar-phosphate isomerase [Nitrospirae bacterium]|nr:KpsF/GutQ family sugar-phosphate isomerase [Nitrospirota bacterium]MBF0535813.1 KpsF/GutQ family sugar-phosphate isomerase [Nitrospirota bacterium]MBF0617722.1 KpsF/GutQ family sugar-phosphate isomerase [Nitrospirota bacterium]